MTIKTTSAAINLDGVVFGFIKQINIQTNSKTFEILSFNLYVISVLFSNLQLGPYISIII